MNKSFLLKGAIVAFSAAFFANFAVAADLTIGDKAPKLSFSQMAQGEMTKEFKSGHVYVVEFWATWCGPCKTSIPHINELAKKYKDKVTVIGASVWESDETTLDDIKEFISQMNGKMTYSVGLDTKEAFMATNWMEAASQNGIPTAFIINQSGEIAWIGHPMEMDEPLEKIVNKQWDMAEAKAKAEKAAAKDKALEDFYNKLEGLFEENRYKDIAAEVDKTLASFPDLKAELLPLKAEMLMNFDIPAGNKLVAEIVNGFAKDDPFTLNSMAWLLVDPDANRKGTDLKLALKASKRAVELTKSENPDILDTHARCQFVNGDKKGALATQEKAIKVAKESGLYDEEGLEDMLKRLEEYKKNQ